MERDVEWVVWCVVDHRFCKKINLTEVFIHTANRLYEVYQKSWVLLLE